jgi:hypothetical protein
VFTARYALSPSIKQIRFVFEGLNTAVGKFYVGIVVNGGHVVFFMTAFIHLNLYSLRFVAEFDVNRFLCQDELHTVLTLHITHSMS